MPSESADLPALSSPRGAPTSTSPELTGGAGFSYEDCVAARYAVALLCEETAPGVPARRVTRLSLQQASQGHPLDDIVVRAIGVDEIELQLSLQVKRKLVISDAKTNGDFRQVVLAAYDTITGPGFRRNLDRVGVATDDIANSARRDFQALCDWARADGDTASFVQKVRTEGMAGKKQAHFDVVRGILGSNIADDVVDSAAHCLLANFTLLHFEMGGGSLVGEAEIVSTLAEHLDRTDRLRADDLWRRLLSLVRVSQGEAASYDRQTLVARLNGSFRLAGAPSMRGALAWIKAEALQAASEVASDIAGVTIPRSRVLETVRKASATHRVVHICGMPGTGKSAILRCLAEEELSKGPTLFIKAERLTGATWAQYATASGHGALSLDTLLVELGATGSSTLFIDGLDRVDVKHRGAVLDVVNAILRSDAGISWKVVTTLRDTGIEPLRTWFGPHIGQGVIVVDVGPFDDDEATLLSKAHPLLKPLLFGSDQVQTIARRPFFAAVLARRANEEEVPSSEIELATIWWERGGYGADAGGAGKRRKALIQLAWSGAPSLGRRMQVFDVDSDVIAELQVDGILRSERAGQTVTFVHDIYFEWAFLQMLVSRGTEWVAAIQELGEPPALGRVVELLSQSELKYGNQWQSYLVALEGNVTLRSQWLRAWMIGPIGLPSFSSHEGTYAEAMLLGDAARVAKLTVWFQAEKTRANVILLNTEVIPTLTTFERLQAADMHAWPSDVEMWQRCCLWLLRNAEKVPASTRADILPVLEVWQSAFADIANGVSRAIVTTAIAWLREIETESRRVGKAGGGTKWAGLKHRESEELVGRLRTILLRAGRAYPQEVTQYIVSLTALERIGRETLDQILEMAVLLGEVCPRELVDFVLRALIRPLPEEVARRSSKLGISHGSLDQEWRSLSLDDQFRYFPPSPIREPFLTLFRCSASEALRLVREALNHSIAAWRQLHQLDFNRRATPLPLVLEFPWGAQTFWGGAREYAWFRGAWGPHVVSSALMALEEWAFLQIEQGRPVDDVLRDVLEGQGGVGAVGVAVAVALGSNHLSEVTLPLMASQRLWAWDIERVVADGNARHNLTGFRSANDPHYQAVLKSNSHRVRQLELRGLASFCIVSGGELGAKLAASLVGFPDNLPFDYAEEGDDPGTVARLGRTAEIWAEMGKASNYRATRAQNGLEILIELDNPKAQGPDIEEMREEHAELFGSLSLLHWVDKCLENSGLSAGMGIDAAVQRATELDSATLFGNACDHTTPGFHHQGIVAGVAAVVVCIQPDVSVETQEWARDVCRRAWQTPEATNNYFSGSAVVPFHPVHYATCGLAVLLRNNERWQAEALDALIHVATHPYDRIAVGALGSMLRVWSEYPRIAWLGLELGINLSLTDAGEYGMSSEKAATCRTERLSRALGMAFARRDAGDEQSEPLPALPAAWVWNVGSPKAAHANVEGYWRHANVDLETSFVTEILKQVPVAVAMRDSARREHFLAWCEELVRWTIEKVCPAWSRKGEGQKHDLRQSELYEWRRELYAFLARVSSCSGVARSVSGFVEPVTAVDDATFGSLAEAYVSMLACQIMDEKEFPEASMQLLEVIVPRVVSHGAWKSAWGIGGGFHDAELNKIVKAMFFIEIEDASMAARFANGDWRDVLRVVPLVAPLLVSHGSNPIVAGAFIRRCELAFEFYPIDLFASQVPHILGSTAGLPRGWRGSGLPARLGGLIQRFSEKARPLSSHTATALLRALDSLVDMGDRRAAAIQASESFRHVRVEV